MKRLRSALRFIILLAITKNKARTFLVECAFAACLGYGISLWSLPAALVTTGAIGIAAIEVRSR